MRRPLIDKLGCPECRGGMEIAAVTEENPVRIVRGTLRCSVCARTYPVENGEPRLIKVTPDVAEVCRRYSFQWLSRWNGKFEGKRCYGFDDDIYVGWVNQELEVRRPF